MSPEIFGLVYAAGAALMSGLVGFEIARYPKGDYDLFGILLVMMLWPVLLPVAIGHALGNLGRRDDPTREAGGRMAGQPGARDDQ